MCIRLRKLSEYRAHHEQPFEIKVVDLNLMGIWQLALEFNRDFRKNGVVNTYPRQNNVLLLIILF